MKETREPKGIKDTSDVKRRMDLIDLEETVNRCALKISFISEFFGQETPGELKISDGAIGGLLFFLQDIQDDLDRVSDRIAMVMRGEKDKNPKKARAQIASTREGILRLIETARTTGKI